MAKSSINKEKAFNNWTHNSIHLTFPNGNAISTIWGYLSYCDNRYHKKDKAIIKDKFDGKAYLDNFQRFMDCDNCEVMILNAPDKLLKKIHKKYEFGGDPVKGYVSITEWLEIVNLLAKDNVKKRKEEKKGS